MCPHDYALLDTCALIRLGGYPETLSDEARATIENAWYLFVSPISLWEIVFKHKIGKLKLAQPPKEWFATLQLGIPQVDGLCASAATPWKRPRIVALRFGGSGSV